MCCFRMTLLTKKLPKSELGTLLEFGGVFSPWCWDQRFFLGSSPGPSVCMTDVACGIIAGEVAKPRQMWVVFLVFWCFQAVLRTRSAHMLWQGHCFCRYVLHRDLVLEIFFEGLAKSHRRNSFVQGSGCGSEEILQRRGHLTLSESESCCLFSALLKGMLMLQRTPGSCALGCCVAKSWPFLRPTLRSDFKLLALLDVSYQEERLNKWGHPDRLGTTIWGKDISKHPRLIFCYWQGTPNTSRHLVRSLAYTKFAGWLAQDSKIAEWAWGWVRLRLQHRHHMASPRTVSRTGKWCWFFFRATWRGTA